MPKLRTGVIVPDRMTKIKVIDAAERIEQPLHEASQQWEMPTELNHCRGLIL